MRTGKWWAQSAAVAALFVTTGALGHLLAVPPGLATPIWLPSGISVAAAWLYGCRVFPGILLGAFLVGVIPLAGAGAVGTSSPGALMGISLMIAVGVTAEPFLAAALYRRLRQEGFFLSRARNVAVLLLVAAPAGCLVSATLSTATLAATSLIPWSGFGHTWAIWMIGDMIGIYALTPAVLVWMKSDKSQMSARDERIAALSVFSLALICFVTFFGFPPITVTMPLGFLPIPLMVFIAYRFTDRLASLIGPGVASVAIFAATNGSGPFAGDPTHPSSLALQLFVLVGTLTALFTRAVANERNAAERESRLLSSELAHVSRVTMMGEIAAGMAHEYHQPLAAISNYASASLIKLRRFDDAYREVRESLERIVDEAMRASEIVDRMKEFLQKREPSRSLCDADEIVADAIMLTRMSHSFPNIALKHQPTPRLPPAAVDVVQITQILVNLLVNSCEAIESSGIENGEVRVRVQVENADRLHIYVEDNGPGMDEKTAASCFDQFYSTKEHGLGIGLGISRTLAAAHGGRLSLEPSPNGGTTFCLDLPIQPASSSDAAPIKLAAATASRA